MTPEEALRFRDRLVEYVHIHHRDLDAVWPCRPGETNQIFATVLAQCQLVLWKPDLWDAAIRGGAQAFEGVPFDEKFCYTVPQIWLHGHKIILEDGQADALGWPPGSFVLGVVLVPAGRTPTLTVTYLGTLKDHSRLIFSRMSAFKAGDEMDRGVAHFAAMLAFLDQEFVGLERQTLPRHFRRQAELGRRIPLPEINVVTLRRSARKESDGSGGGAESRDWSCQWLVGAHWRKQLCRKRDANGEKTKDGEWEVRPVYVPAHVKGPEGLPLRQPKGTVYAVRR